MTAVQTSLFDAPAPPEASKWYEPLMAIMRDGCWHSIEDVALALGYNATGAAARIRDLRKIRYGAHRIDRKGSGVPGVYLYRLAGGHNA